MNRHPTAIIHPDAELAGDVRVGPYVCIEGPAKIGAGCVIQPHAILTGSVRIGKNNIVGYGAVIGADPQDLSFRPETRSEVCIGDNNRIREYCTIHRGSKEGSATRLGNGNFLMAGAHLGHNVSIGNNVVIANNVLLGGHVEVQDQSFLGGGAVFHQFVRVGRMAITQGNSAFSKDIPPFMVGARVNFVAGLNVIGMRRAGFGPKLRGEIKEAFKLVYKSGLNKTQALENARERKWSEECAAFFDFIEAAKKRGICDLLEAGRFRRYLAVDEADEQ